MTVQLSDVNLGSPAGAEVALRRISNAAGLVCGGSPDLRDLSRRAAYDRCRREAIQDVVSKLDRPQVSALLNPAPVRSLASR